MAEVVTVGPLASHSNNTVREKHHSLPTRLPRFGCSMKELIRLFEVFDTDRIPLVFLDVNRDTSTSKGRRLRHILAAFEEHESDVKAELHARHTPPHPSRGHPWGPGLAGSHYLLISASPDPDGPHSSLQSLFSYQSPCD